MQHTTNASPQVDAAGKAILARHADWWQRKGMLYAEVPGGPLRELWLPLSDGSVAREDLDLTPDMLDLDRLAGNANAPGPLDFVGDHVATRAPYTPVPWVEAIMGCPIHATIQGGSMRTRHLVGGRQDWERRLARRRPWQMDRTWLDALLALTERLAARSGGRYAVAQTLMRGPSDLAEAALGPELMSLAMYDHPQALHSFLGWATDLFLEVLRAQLARIPQVEGGYVNPFGVWSPGTVVRTQCDASAFLSPEQYRAWYLPYDERISAAVDYSVIHLHSGSLHTIEPLMAVERPRAIQVSLDPEPSGPPVKALLPAFRRVLEGKPLIVDGAMTPEDARLLQDELPHDGLYILWRGEPA